MVFYEKVLSALYRQRVKFVVVGGLAFNLQGGNRATFDLDLLVEMSDENLKKIIRVLLDCGFHPKQPVDPLDFAVKKVREEWISEKSMKAFNFYKSEKSLEEVDILIDSPVNYEGAIRNAQKIKIKSCQFFSASLEDLIRMKEGTGREKDAFDIQEMQKIKALRHGKKKN